MDILPLDELALGSQKAMKVGGRDVLFVRTEDGVYALNNQCSHAKMPLQDGLVEAGVIRCPFHGAKYYLETGLPVAGRLERVSCFEVKLESGRILIKEETEHV